MAPTRAPGRDSRHLARVLRTGSFAEALDAAITARGLTLDRLCHHLADRGVHVSRTTLSYWRRNRSRPERQASLRAVRALEDLLGLPSSSLVALLGPPRPRGRWLNELPDSCDRAYLWPSAAPGMAQLDAEPEGRFEALSIHDLVTVAPDRSELRMRSRAVLRALRGPVDRCLAFYQAEDPAHAVPALVDLRFCARGRQRYDPDSKLFVAELLLDRTVAAGEDTVIEYELGFGPGVPMDYFHHRFHRRCASTCCRSSSPARFRVPVTATESSRWTRRSGARGRCRSAPRTPRCWWSRMSSRGCAACAGGGRSIFRFTAPPPDGRTAHCERTGL